MKTGRNDPCPCGALTANGRPKKYKHCHLAKERQFSVQTHTKPEVINSHTVMRDGKWHNEPGLLNAILVFKRPEDVDEQIEELFKPVMLSVGQYDSDLATRLLECKHKVYACSYHLNTIARAVEQEVEKFKKEYKATAGAKMEVENH